MNDLAWLRLLDANINRAVEGLRVLEDVARFVLSDDDATRTLKNVRHLFGHISIELSLSGTALAVSRMSATDVGRTLTTRKESHRRDWLEIVVANSKRVGESARILEESIKLVRPQLAEKIKQARYTVYDVEARIERRFDIRRKLDFDLYVVTNRKAQHGRRHVAVARVAIRGGAKIIQLRDKDAPIGEYYRDALAIAKLCKKHNVTFIVNDYMDICRAVDADGVHMGQEDLPVAVARRVLGPDKILGYSTHNEREAVAAEKGGADYVSVGPIFETPSKEGWEPRGTRFVRWAAKNLSIPFVAIGGIDSYNVAQVIRAGACRVAVIRAAVGAKDVVSSVRELRRRIARAK